MLVALDGYNTWFRRSLYPSFRYANDKNLRGHIPPKDVALIRLLMKFDGHMIRQGVKYVGTSHWGQFNHIMKPH